MRRIERETEVIRDASAVILTLFCIQGIRYSSLSIILLLTSCTCSTIKAFESSFLPKCPPFIYPLSFGRTILKTSGSETVLLLVWCG